MKVERGCVCVQQLGTASHEDVLKAVGKTRYGL